MIAISPYDRDAWLALNLPPATPEQLKQLAELFGIRVFDDSSGYLSIYNGTSSDLIIICTEDAPIERYIAAIAEWRRERP